MNRVHMPCYGRKLDDFRPGDVYAHPWDVTIDHGMRALFAASFQDAVPTFASARYARELGFSDRPVHPLLLLNLGLSFSVHDVSEQAIAHLAYIDVRFPAPCYAGDTVTATSRVLAVKPSSKGDRGVVEVRTHLENERGDVVCRFDRRALVRSGRVSERPISAWPAAELRDSSAERLPGPLREHIAAPLRHAGFSGFFEDFSPGDIFVHTVGKTVGETEHMQLTQLCRNSHPIHFDEVYCRQNSFTQARVVYGGLVLGWTLALASRDTAGNAIWEVGLDEGAHPSAVQAGDTLYASSQVLGTEDFSAEAGMVVLRVVGTKNRNAAELAQHPAFFRPELGKSEDRIPDKVVEITRTLLVRKRSAVLPRPA